VFKALICSLPGHYGFAMAQFGDAVSATIFRRRTFRRWTFGR